MNNHFNSNEASVVYASDDRFAEILGISIVSIFENNRDMDLINLYILDSGISSKNKKYIAEVCNKYNRPNPTYIKAVNICEYLSMEVSIDRGSLSQYARLFISNTLPSNLKRVLYLDCDIIVNKSIKELWNIDLEGKIIGALLDAFSKFYRKNIDLKPNDIMFNSGVMLIDLNKWREKNIEEKLITFIKKHRGKIQQGDQGALNAVLSDEVYCFEPKYNAVTIFFDFSYNEMLFYRKPPEFYTMEQIKEAVENPCIIHFTTSFISKRPWVVGCKHRYSHLWLKYKGLSPWADMPLWGNDNDKFINKILRFFVLVAASFLQVYFRPFVNRIKNTVR